MMFMINNIKTDFILYLFESTHSFDVIDGARLKILKICYQ